MKHIEFLRAAKAKLADPAAWAQGFYAYRPAEDGWRPAELVNGTAMQKTHASDQGATCWCVRGAVMSVALNDHSSGSVEASLRAQDLLTAAYRRISKAGPSMQLTLGDVAKFNDAPVRRHADIINLLDVAIELAEEEEACEERPYDHH
jgi:hypothetical protein